MPSSQGLNFFNQAFSFFLAAQNRFPRYTARLQHEPIEIVASVPRLYDERNDFDKWRPAQGRAGNQTTSSDFGHFCAEVPKSLHIVAYPRVLLIAAVCRRHYETPASSHIRFPRASEMGLIAMQKVVGSNPISRLSRNPALGRDFVVQAGAFGKSNYPRGGKLRSQLAALHPASSMEKIEEAIQAACDRFVDKAVGISRLQY